MNDEEALLAAICARPEEDTPRLAFADYLQELGGNVHNAWAYLIRAQVRLARDSGDDLAPTGQRVRQLNAPYWHSQWFARLGIPVEGRLNWGDWARGFPVGVTASPESLRLAWPRIAQSIPFTTLGLTGTTEADVRDLTLQPELARVRELHLNTDYNQPALAEFAFQSLAACPFLRGLRRLRISSGVLSDTTATAVLDSPHLTGLQVLRVASWPNQRVGSVLSFVTRVRLETRFGEDVAGF